MIKIDIVYHDKEMPKIELIEGKSDWYDLRAAEDIALKAGESTKISLGVSMRIPDGYEAHLVPRSSTFDRWGIIQTNGMGVIDNSYAGTNDIWKMPVYAVRDTQIKKYDRICQFRIEKKQDPAVFSECSELNEKDRGGFGVTGAN